MCVRVCVCARVKCMFMLISRGGYQLGTLHDALLAILNFVPRVAVFFFCERHSFNGMSEILAGSASTTADLARSNEK